MRSRSIARAKAIREKLKTPTARRARPGVRTWMAERQNQSAVELVTAWLEMKFEGTTDWPLSRLHRELMEEHGLPYRCPTAFLKWISSDHHEAYEKAMRRDA